MEQYNIMKVSDNEQALKWVLNDCGIPKHAVSIGGPSEQSICLEKTDSMYTVYMIERGKRFEESRHESEREAHLKVLYHIAPTKEAYTEMRNLYERRIRLQNAKKKRAFIQTYYGSKHGPTGLVAASRLPVVAAAAINIGDTVRIRTKVNNGLRDQIQVFEGQVVCKKTTGPDQTITIRRNSHGVTFEKAFAITSPKIDSIETIGKGKTGRTKHFKVYGKTGKVAKYKKKV